MRENRTYGSEGGATVKAVVPTPIFRSDRETRQLLIERSQP